MSRLRDGTDDDCPAFAFLAHIKLDLTACKLLRLR